MGSAVLASGCFSTSNYHTAETLPKGNTSLGFGWGVTSIESVSTTDADGNKEEADTSGVPSIPNIIPDVILRFGVTDNLEAGAKFFLVGAQADLKWRFFNNDFLHLAVDPTVTYARPFLVLEETSFALPVMATARISKMFAVYASAKAFASRWSLPASGEDADEANSGLSDLGLFGIGATVGLSIDFKRFWIRPEFNYVDYVIGVDDSVEEVGFSYSSFGLGLGFNFGGDEKRMDDLEERMKKLESKEEAQ